MPSLDAAQRRRLPFFIAQGALQCAFLVGMVLSAIQGRFLPVGQLFCALVLTVLPSFLARKFNWQWQDLYQLVVSVFVFLCIFLGTYLDIYEIFPWWDDFLHFCSGALFCIAGIIVVNTVLSRRQAALPFAFILLFGFCFAMTSAGLWEIWEFSTDRLFGFNSQEWLNGYDAGLFDTMMDIIDSTVGSILVMLCAGIGRKARAKRPAD